MQCSTHSSQQQQLLLVQQWTGPSCHPHGTYCCCCCQVLDLGQVVAGNFCGAVLGYFGADVIKVTPPSQQQQPDQQQQ